MGVAMHGLGQVRSGCRCSGSLPASSVLLRSAYQLIQDMASWVRDGIGGLQSVVLYSLPELDGAIDTGGHCSSWE